MKWIKYMLCDAIDAGTEDEPKITKTYTGISRPWSETNEELAKREAYSGEYTIEDDGQPEPEPEPTQLDRVEAQAVYTAMMTDTLLESEV